MSEELNFAKSVQSLEDVMRERDSCALAESEWRERCEMKDENGISVNMLDHSVEIFAEGFRTGEIDIRHFLYCVIRDALVS